MQELKRRIYNRCWDAMGETNRRFLDPLVEDIMGLIAADQLTAAAEPQETAMTESESDAAPRVHDCALGAYLQSTATAAEEHARFETKLARDLRDARIALARRASAPDRSYQAGLMRAAEIAEEMTPDQETDLAAHITAGAIVLALREEADGLEEAHMAPRGDVATVTRYPAEADARASQRDAAPEADWRAVAWQWHAGREHAAIHGAGWTNAKTEARARDLAQRFGGKARPLYAASPAPVSAGEVTDIIRALCDLVQAMLDNDPDEPIADGGHVMLDMWRYDAKPILADARAALTAAQPRADAGEVTQWRSIKSAPRDDTRILLSCPLGRRTVIGRWRTNVYDNDINWTTDEGESVCLHFDPPTHWMPLPSPPEPSP